MSGRRTSIAWKYFKDIGNYKSICNICKETLSYRTSVSNLQKHIKRKHPTAISNNVETYTWDDHEYSTREKAQNNEEGPEAPDHNTDSQVDARIRGTIKNDQLYFELQDSNDELETIEIQQDVHEDDDVADPVFVEFLEHSGSSPTPKRENSLPPSPRPSNTILRKKRKRHIYHKEVNDEEENQVLNHRHLLEIKRLELETLREKNHYEKEKVRAEIDRDTIKVQERFVAFLEDIKPALIKFLDK